MKLIVGLGNTGAQYEHTRHNIGFVAIDKLAASLGASQFHPEVKYSAEVAEAIYKGEKIYLLKPMTMMNDSGKAVVALASFYKIKPADIWVIFDDVDLPLGTVRLRQGGSSGQHGVQSIIERIGADFVRVRIGIGSNRDVNQPSEQYVLAPFSDDQLYARDVGLKRGLELVLSSLETGIIPKTVS